MLQAKKIDATRGALIPLIIAFVIPMILTTLIQQLFNAVDIAVLGNMADSNAVASVGATSPIIHLLIDTFVGLSSGAKIVFARLFGKKDEQELQKALNTTIVMAGSFGVLATVVGFFLAPLCLHWLNCPAECFDGAVTYMRIYIFSIPAVLLYNYGSAILTSSGDTRRPLYYAVASGLLNVVLNIVLCLVLEQKVAAVAIATASSQILAATLVLIRLRRLEGNVRLRIRKIAFHFRTCLQILRFGIPIALQALIYPVANLQISSAINSYGVACVAGNSASSTVEQMAASIQTAFGSATSTFMGQNIGANKPDRVRKSVIHTTWMVLVSGIPLGILIWLTSPVWLKIFLGNDTLAIEFAMVRIAILMLNRFFICMNAVLGHAVQAFGYPIFSTVNAVMWVLGFRFVWMGFIYPLAPSYASLIWCFAVSWMLTFLCNAVLFGIFYSRYRKGKYKRI